MHENVVTLFGLHLILFDSFFFLSIFRNQETSYPTAIIRAHSILVSYGINKFHNGFLCRRDFAGMYLMELTISIAPLPQTHTRHMRNLIC